jgi:hypothetical protein
MIISENFPLLGFLQWKFSAGNSFTVDVQALKRTGKTNGNA